MMPQEILLVGDRLLTDILMANKTGMASVHTQPLTQTNDNPFAKTVVPTKYGRLTAV